MRISLAFSMALMIVGALLTIWCLNSAKTTSFNELMKLGPMLITTAVAALPLKAFFSYRCRVATYVFLLNCCSDPDPAITQLINEAIKNLLKLD
jgi:hypothetical protein